MNKVRSLAQKDLLGLKDISLADIQLILKTAESMKEVMFRPVKRVPALVGKTILTLFYEPSTRTKTSFDMAAKVLSATTSAITVASSSVKKGETLVDTAKNVERTGVDAIVIRHAMAGAPHLIAKNLKIPVINAGDGFNEHPTQGLLDIFTMKEKKGDLKGKHLVIVGDISHSRVARSNIWGLKKIGAKITVVAPLTLLPKDIKLMGVEVSHDLDQAIQSADFVNILRIQLERQEAGLFPSKEEYAELYGLNSERLRKAKKGLVIMHPGPINRGVEITSEVADLMEKEKGSPYSVILDQVENGVAVRMAVLFLLLGGNTD